MSDAGMQDDNKVLIVGAGLAGLALAQLLRKQGLPYEIFERDAQIYSRGQGWAVALVEAVALLKDQMPSDVPPLRKASVNANLEDVSDTLASLNGDTGAMLTKLGGAPEGTPGYLLRADRQRLRELLFTGLDVQMGKQFDSYVEDENGVTVTFKDGTQARGAILVGADGAHSHVRAQLMADTPHDPVLSKYIPLVGECEVSAEEFAPLRELANAVVISIRPGLLVQIGQRSIKPDMSSATYFWTVCYQSQTPDVDSAWAHSASKEELWKKTFEVMEGIQPSLIVDFIRLTGFEGMVTPPLKFIEFVSPNALPASRVTLVGDAAHSMIPFKAAGANTAIQDVVELAKLIADRAAANKTVAWKDLLQEYEVKMLPRGREKVLASRAVGEGSQLPVESNERINFVRKD